MDASKKLHEQSKLIQEAIMEAVLDRMTTATDIYVSVKQTLIEKATNFTCTDVLSDNVSSLMKILMSREVCGKIYWEIQRISFKRIDIPNKGMEVKFSSVKVSVLTK